jgi:hypothetical protein
MDPRIPAGTGGMSVALWNHVYGARRGILALFSGSRPRPVSRELLQTRTEYFEWPAEWERARGWIDREAKTGRETYHCTHLLTARRRIKKNAARVGALWVDGDGAKVTGSLPEPTAVVLSSPGREQHYWRLTSTVEPAVAETLNRRLAAAMGGDGSGWDLTQLLRPPGTPNFKYAAAPTARLARLVDERHDPEELDRLLPPLPEKGSMPAARRSERPKELGNAPEPSRLSRRMQDLIRYGNRGEYPSRSEADMAACMAMFGAGYGEAEVWGMMTDPINGISEKFLEKGRDGDRYLALTIGKAEALARASTRRRSEDKVYTRRKGVISVG